MGRNPYEHNLKNGEKTQFTSGKKAAESGRRGGIASGEAKRRKKALKEGIAAMMNEETPDAVKKQFNKAGFEVATNYDALVAAVIMGGIKGNTKMLELITDVIGEKERDKVKREALELERERWAVERKRTEAETKKIELMNEEASGASDDDTDDGFLEALKGTARDDWKDEADDDPEADEEDGGDNETE